MAIYGQMTSQPSTSADGEEEEVTRDKLHEVTAEATRDLEDVLSHLSESIDELTGDAPVGSREAPRPSDPPHFTLATSPTHRRPQDSEPPRNPPNM